MNIWKIKWEIIITPVFAIGFITCLVSHIKNYGFDLSVVGTLFIAYTFITTGMYACLYHGRKDILENK